MTSRKVFCLTFITIALTIGALIFFAGAVGAHSNTNMILDAAPKAQADEECSNSSLRGSFGVTSTGTIIGVGPLSAVGVVTFDGQGNHVGFDTISINGSIVPKLTFTGTYKVNADCTGSDTENFQNGLTILRNFVIVDGGQEIRFIVTNAGNAVTAIARKIRPGNEDRSE